MSHLYGKTIFEDSYAGNTLFIALYIIPAVWEWARSVNFKAFESNNYVCWMND